MRNKLFVTTNPMEIRQLEIKTGKKTGSEYFYIRAEDDKTGDSWQFYDSNMEHYNYLRRKQIVIFTLEISEWERQLSVRVKDFRVLNDEIKEPVKDETEDEKKEPASADE